MARIHRGERHLERRCAVQRLIWLVCLALAAGLAAAACWLLFRPLTPLAAMLAATVEELSEAASGPLAGLLSGMLGFFARIGVQLLMGVAACAALAVGGRAKRSADILAAGISGERRALGLLKELPDEYHVLTNCRISHNGGQSETDLIVVGPAGVSVVEVKNHRGCVSGDVSDHELSLRKTDRYGLSHDKRIYNPVKQVSTHVFRLAGLLRRHGHYTWVQGYVLFTHGESEVRLTGECGVPAYAWRQREELLKALQGSGRRLTEAEVQAIVVLLRKQ